MNRARIRIGATAPIDLTTAARDALERPDVSGANVLLEALLATASPHWRYAHALTARLARLGGFDRARVPMAGENVRPVFALLDLVASKVALEVFAREAHR